jgi:phenylacetate-CoA ligase
MRPLPQDARAARGCRLIQGTYYDAASPFSRYDLDDDIVPLQDSRNIGAFRITAGRRADVLIDPNGQRIGLTALIFGRHREACGAVAFVQVRQSEQGRATVLLVPASEAPRLRWSGRGYSTSAT